jgi:hypothetical protein
LAQGLLLVKQLAFTLRCRMRPVIGGLLLVVALSFPRATSAQSVIGGASPDRRPDGVPTIGSFELGKAERARALRGITKPYPASLEFLANQGAWYTPFSHPGATGPYDIRGLHSDKQ